MKRAAFQAKLSNVCISSMHTRVCNVEVVTRDITTVAHQATPLIPDVGNNVNFL